MILWHWLGEKYLIQVLPSKNCLVLKTQSLWQNIYFHHQPNPLKSIGGENNLAGDMKNNNRKSIM